MRIVQVCPFSWDAVGGVQSHVRQLSAELRSRGHDVLVLAPGDVPGWRDDGTCIVGRTFEVHTNGSVARLACSPSALETLARMIHAFEPDVVHVHEPFAVALGFKAVWSSPVPVVATFHSYFAGSTSAGRLYSALSPLLRPTWRQIDRRVAVSVAAKWSVTSRLGPGAIEIIPNGVDVERFARATPASGLPDGRRLLFVGRLEPRKGLPIAIDAFAQLADRHPELHLLVVGDGPERNAPDRLPPALRARVHLLGSVSDDVLPSIYRAADIFVAPARGAESFGIVLAEAMAAGVPVVASRIAGYRDVARAGREAILVRPSDATALADGIGHLLDDPDDRARLAANGAIRARDFAWPLVADQLEAAYASVGAATVRVPAPALATA
jgi:phosphatidylinositol alpha-mannosyltransferase